MDGVMAAIMAHLHSSLDQVLDLDAGLADARLPDLHKTLTNLIGKTLDIEAGSASILPPAPATNPACSLTGLEVLARDLDRSPPKERLIVRTWFPFREMHYLRSIAELVGRGLRRNGKPLYESDQASELALILGQTDGPAATLLARNLARAIREFSGARTDISRRVAGRDMLYLAIGFILHLVHDVEIRNALMGERLMVRDHRALIGAIDRVIDAVTSVAGADLRDMDLRGIPLEGLRWSNQTRWPDDWEFYIVENSVEIEPGLFEIRFGDVDAIV